MISYERFLEKPSVIDLISSGDIGRIVRELGKAEFGDGFDYLVLPMLCYILKQKDIGANIGGRIKGGMTDARIILYLSSPTNEFTERSFNFLIRGFNEYSENKDPLIYTPFGLLELATRNRGLEHTFISPFINSEGKWKFGTIETRVQGGYTWKQ